MLSFCDSVNVSIKHNVVKYNENNQIICRIYFY